MLDVKLKLQPGHRSDVDWMAPSPLKMLFWDVTNACNYHCGICFSNSGRARPDELTTEEAKAAIRNAHAAGVRDIVISGGEPFARPDLVELLETMGDLGIASRIASNGSLIPRETLERVRGETLTKSFQISLDTLDHELYSAVHGTAPDALDTALRAVGDIQDLGFHTTVSSRPTPATLEGIPALLDRACAEGWQTVTLHCPVPAGRSDGTWARETDMISQLEPIFEHFLQLPEHWVVEFCIPWARYHPVVRRLAEQIDVAHAGCCTGRSRLAINASGDIIPCVCMDGPEARMGNVRTHDLGEVFAESPLADMMRNPQEHGVCDDCPNVAVCGGGCRAAAYALTGRVDGLDPMCPIRRKRNSAGEGGDGCS